MKEWIILGPALEFYGCVCVYLRQPQAIDSYLRIPTFNLDQDLKCSNSSNCDFFLFECGVLPLLVHGIPNVLING